ncbi:MAG: ABC transporter substrate-binding protein [Firmicutes bacterium]|nr:ABC transporter substrate-binding protein [Bacillota bacterium]
MRSKRLISGLLMAILVFSLATIAYGYNEAPMLKELVEVGKLPSVNERLPKNPMVVDVVERIGDYGGTLRTSSIAADSMLGPHVIVMGDGILKTDSDYSTVIPNVAEAWELSDDATRLTLHLREGLRWSDGVPFDADDIMFWWDDVELNEEIRPVGPSRRVWCPGGEPMKVRKIDDYTVEFEFAIPNPLNVRELAHGSGMAVAGFPKHYLKQFHPKYTPKEELDKIIAADDAYDYWYEMFLDKASRSSGIAMHPGVPTLSAFVVVSKEPGVIRLERNPYYWKVDPEGNQLPYIDKVVVRKASNITTVNSLIITGEEDFNGFHTSLQNLTTYKQFEDQGDYRVLLYNGIWGTEVMIQFNQTLDDPVWRDIVRDVRFRRGMSLAINREEINDTLYFGLGEPRQATVVPICSSFEPEFATAYAQYDLDEANRLLDAVGLDQRDSTGYRLRPDGKRFTITVEYCEADTPKTPTMELVREYWEAVGVHTNLKLISNTLLAERVPTNEVQVGVHHGDYGTDSQFYHYPVWYVPLTLGWSTSVWPQWARWFTSHGTQGEEPSPEVLRLIELWEEMQVTLDDSERVELGKDLLRLHAENTWLIGTVGNAPYVVIAKNNLRNIPETGWWGYDGFFGYVYSPEQFFLEQN